MPPRACRAQYDGRHPERSTYGLSLRRSSGSRPRQLRRQYITEGCTTGQMPPGYGRTGAVNSSICSAHANFKIIAPSTLVVMLALNVGIWAEDDDRRCNRAGSVSPALTCWDLGNLRDL